LKPFYDTIIISPHLDDAALSCGGQISLMTRAGQTVLIVTVMAGEPEEPVITSYAQTLHDRWQLKSNAVVSRRQEDIIAAQILGADVLHFEFPDCIYRLDTSTGAPCYLSDEEIFGDINPGDSDIINKVAERLAALPRSKEIIVPLGVGNHVDHQIARQATELVFGRDLLYYEEFPYAAEPGAYDLVVGESPSRWHTETIPLPEEALQMKIKAISAYISQLSTFFENQQDLERQVRRFTVAVGGERIWRQNASKKAIL